MIINKFSIYLLFWFFLSVVQPQPLPTSEPTISPTSQKFLCPDLWDNLVNIDFPISFTETRERWAPVFNPKKLKKLNNHVNWKIGAMWTLEMTVTSTCSNDLVFSFSSTDGSFKVLVPANAMEQTITVVDTISHTPSYFYMRNKCKERGAEVTFTSVKIGEGSCNIEAGPTLIPTSSPTPITFEPTQLPTAPSAFPTLPPTTGLWVTSLKKIDEEIITSSTDDTTRLSTSHFLSSSRSSTNYGAASSSSHGDSSSSHADDDDSCVDTYSSCGSYVRAGKCPTYFCATCPYANYCDASCDYCSDTYTDDESASSSSGSSSSGSSTDDSASSSSHGGSSSSHADDDESCVDTYSSCRSYVNAGKCPTYFCATCPYANYCDASCDYCSGSDDSTSTDDTSADDHGDDIVTNADSPYPSARPSVTLSPSLTQQPTSESFTCPNLWDSLVDISSPFVFTNTETKWAPVFTPPVGSPSFVPTPLPSHLPTQPSFSPTTPVAQTCGPDNYKSGNGGGGSCGICVDNCGNDADEVLSFFGLTGTTASVSSISNNNGARSYCRGIDSSLVCCGPKYTSGGGGVFVKNSGWYTDPTHGENGQQPDVGSANSGVCAYGSPGDSSSWIMCSGNDAETCEGGGDYAARRLTTTYDTDAETLDEGVNDHPKWEVGEIWTLQMTVTSTCPDDLTFAFTSAYGDLVIVVPALAESSTVTVVDSLSYTPSYFHLRNKCSTSSEVIFRDIKLSPGSCNPILAPTLEPTPSPTSFPTMIPLPVPTSLPIPVPTVIPIPSPTSLPIPGPTTVPIPSPSSVPIPSPTSVPIPVPTALPIPSPTSVPIPAPSSYPTLVPSASQLPSSAPSLVPSSFPSSLPSLSPTNDTWLGSWTPTTMPSPFPTPHPTAAAPVVTLVPTHVPTLSLLPSLSPTLQPTTASFRCADVWDDLVDIEMPFNFTNTQTKWAPVFVPRDLRFLNEHAHWEVGEMWTMETTVSSTCGNDLIFSFCSRRGFLKIVVPAYATNFTITVVDTIKFAPSYYYMRNRCQNAGSVTFSDVKLGFGSCNLDVGPTIYPTYLPSSIPTISLQPTLSPSHIPTYLPSSVPTSLPSSIPIPLPSSLPSSLPTSHPTPSPSSLPLPFPTLVPRSDPSSLPSAIPTLLPTPLPSMIPSMLPSSTPSSIPSALPSILPSPLPTQKPSFGPSPRPSISPTSDPTPVTPYPTATPTGYCPNDLLLLHPVMKVDHGVAWASSPTIMDDNSTVSREFGLLSGSVAPGAHSDFTVFLNDKLIGQHGSFTKTIPEMAGRVEIFAVKSKIYRDQRIVKVAYQLTDSAGRSTVRLGDEFDLQITLFYTGFTQLDVNGTSQTASCESLPNTTSGIGFCSMQTPIAWFSEDHDNEIYASISVLYNTIASVTSEKVVVTCKQLPTFDALIDGNMELVLPFHPLPPGATFDVIVNADTNKQALRTWQFTIEYNAAHLTYVSSTTSTNFTSTFSSHDSEGLLTLSNAGLSNDEASSQVNTGSSIYIATLTFQLNSDVSDMVLLGLFKLTTNSMENDDNIIFVSEKVGQVNDERGTGYTWGQMTVQSVSPVGIFSYAVVSELVNISPLNGIIETSSNINTVLIYDDESRIDISGDVICNLYSLSDLEALSLNSCVAYVSSLHHRGSSQVSVLVEYGDLSALVDMIVWYPQHVDINSSDFVLSPISENCSQYQKAQLSAYAHFNAGDSIKIGDVTDIVRFVSSNEGSITINGTKLEAQEIGSSEISISSFPYDVVTVHVVSTPVSLESLSVIVYTNISWVEDDTLVGLEDSFVPQVQFQRELEGYGDVGHIVVYAEFDDGTWLDVTQEASITLVLGFENILDLQEQDRTVRVIEESGTSWCRPAIYASYSPCNNSEPVSNYGFVKKRDSRAVSCLLTIDEPQIAREGDGATLQPFNITDLATLTVTVFYDDGSSKDFTHDDRAVLTIIDGDILASLTGNKLSVLPTAIIEPDLSWDVTIEVTFPGVYNLSDSVSTTVVEFEYLTLEATHSPSIIELGPILEVRQIACTGLYQRFEMSAIGYLTDGTWKGGVSFSRWVNFSSSDDMLGTFTSQPCHLGLCRGFATTGPGSLIVYGSFAGVPANIPITILGDRVNISSLEILDSIGEFDTLHGIVNTTDNIEVMVGFTDGTSFIVSDFGAETSDWLQPSSLLIFQTNQKNAVSVNDEGILTLLNNYYTTIEVNVKENCANRYSDVKAIYANLDPEEHDVDLGYLFGPSLRQQTIGDYFDVEVRIQASETEPLTAFQVKVIFDYDELRVDSDDYCGRLYGWGWNFECTSNDPEYELLMVGTCGLVNTSECGTFDNNVIGFITFQAVRTGFIHLSGEVIKNMGVDTVTSNVKLFSGDAYFFVVDVDDDVGITENEMQSEANDVLSQSTTNVSINTAVIEVDCGTMQGDTNGDCVCDVAAVRNIQYYISNLVDMSSLSSQAIYSMDANLDGRVDSADVHFLLRIVAYKYRFLADYSTTSNPFTLEISMLTWQSLPSHHNQSNLWLELALNDNKDLDMVFDYGNVTSSVDGVFIVPERLDIGVFGAGGLPRVNEYNVPLVVIVETYNVFGDSSESRLCPFYCTRRIEFCRNAFGDSADAFFPYKYPNLTIPEPTSSPTQSPNWQGANLQATRSASANILTIMAIAAAMIAALIARHFYNKQPPTKQEPFHQYVPEELPFEHTVDGFTAGVFKKWNPNAVPPMQLQSAEFVQDLQEPGILEKGKGGDEGRRANGEVLPGLLGQAPQGDRAIIPDFLALRDPSVVNGKFRKDGAIPVLRMDNSNDWIPEPPWDNPKAFSAPYVPPSRNHADGVSQMPPRFPGGPQLRLDKDSITSIEEEF